MGHADGEGLDVLAEARQIASDVGRVRTDLRTRVLEVFVDFMSEVPEAGSEILAQSLDSHADFGAKGEEVTTRLVPLRHLERDPNRAYGQGCD